jgi:hypothetical protein
MTVAAPPDETAAGGDQAAAATAAAALPPTCTFHVGGVKRTCTAPAVPGTPFCTHHAPDRVRCPVDPTHTVRPDRLRRHVAACTKATAARALAARPFYSPGVNAGGGRGTPSTLPALGVPAPLARPAADRRAAAAALGPARLAALVERVVAAAEVVDAGWPRPPPPGCCCGEAAAPAAGADPVAGGTRHAAQNGAIVAAATGFGVFEGDGDEKNLALVELGAGRGLLGAAAAAARPSAAIAFVDRRPYRAKADRHLRHRRLVRVTADIADVDVGALCGWAFGKEGGGGGTEGGGGGGGGGATVSTPPPPVTRWAVLGKHLCGRATDLALRATVRGLGDGGGDGGQEKQAHPRACGAAVATCCHHSAAWPDFCGKAAFVRAGFDGEAEFGLVSQFAAWALCGHGRPGRKGGEAGEEEGEEGASSDEGEGGDDDDARDAPPAPAWQASIPLATRHAAGAAAKRVLDACRLAWMRAKLAEACGETTGAAAADAVAYVPAEVTGENRLLLVRCGGRGGGGGRE